MLLTSAISIMMQVSIAIYNPATKALNLSNLYNDTSKYNNKQFSYKGS